MAQLCSGFQGFEESPIDIQTEIVSLGRCLGFHESEVDVVEGLIECHNGELANKELCISADHEPCNVNCTALKLLFWLFWKYFESCYCTVFQGQYKNDQPCM
jgi:hypothetical protein